MIPFRTSKNDNLSAAFTAKNESFWTENKINGYYIIGYTINDKLDSLNKEIIPKVRQNLHKLYYMQHLICYIEDSDVGDRFSMLLIDLVCWYSTLIKKILDVGDQNGQNRHQHLIVVTNTFRLQHPSPTSIFNILGIKSESCDLR